MHNIVQSLTICTEETFVSSARSFVKKDLAQKTTDSVPSIKNHYVSNYKTNQTYCISGKISIIHNISLVEERAMQKMGIFLKPLTYTNRPLLTLRFATLLLKIIQFFFILAFFSAFS